jgi:hypothetical protein
MKFRYIKQSLILAMCTSMWVSCSKLDNYLDKAETGGISEAVVFSNYNNTNGFLASIYSKMFHDEWMPSYGVSLMNFTDEGHCAHLNNASNTIMKTGSLSPTSNPLDKWADLYAMIRQTNIFLANIDKVQGDTETQRQDLIRMKGEAYFLRAYAYFELFRRYGGVPIIDRVLNVSDNLNIPRNTAREVVEFIAADCDLAVDLLLKDIPPAQQGRASKGAALMIKSRAYLYLASPLHNPENNQEFWAKAAAASKAVMDLNKYSLHNDYVNLFHTRQSNEIILQSNINFNSHSGWQSQNSIMREWGWANNQPAHNIVDAYEMANGKFINEAGSGYDPQNPYANRDPRLGYSVYHNGSFWKRRTGETPIQTYVGGLDGIYSGPGNDFNAHYTQTGYYLGDKMVDPNGYLQPWPGSTGSNYNIFMRYGETLLNYAEAQNEVLSAPDASVYEAINTVRSRTGVNMPNLPTGLTKEQMRERIRHERRVELAFENHRFWDVRRWKIGEQVLKNVYAMWITKDNNDELSHEVKLLETRVWKEAYNLFPIPQSEMNRNKALVQNPLYN